MKMLKPSRKSTAFGNQQMYLTDLTSIYIVSIFDKRKKHNTKSICFLHTNLHDFISFSDQRVDMWYLFLL